MSLIERSEAEQRAYDEGYRDCAISARAMHDRDMTWRDEENVRLHKQLKGAEEERDRLREVLRAVLMEPDPIKRNQLVAPVLPQLGGVTE
jgi:hypothetical protein